MRTMQMYRNISGKDIRDKSQIFQVLKTKEFISKDGKFEI